MESIVQPTREVEIAVREQMPVDTKCCRNVLVPQPPLHLQRISSLVNQDGSSRVAKCVWSQRC